MLQNGGMVTYVTMPGAVGGINTIANQVAGLDNPAVAAIFLLEISARLLCWAMSR